MEHVAVGGRGVEEGGPTVTVNGVEDATVSFFAQVLGEAAMAVGHGLRVGNRITI